MFNFLKRQREEMVLIENLESWFDYQVEKKFGFLRERITDCYQRINQNRLILKEKSEQLEKAEVDEPEKVETRIRQIVFGHRENFLKQTKLFLEEWETPKENGFGEAIIFISLFNQKLDDFAEKTKKNYSVIKSLFPDQLEAVSDHLRKLSSENKKLKFLLEKNRIKEINEVKRQILLLKRKIKERKEKEREIISLKKELKEIDDFIKIKEEERENLEKSHEYQQFKAFEENKNKLKQKIEENQNQIFSFFSKIERPLRKYSKIAFGQENLIKSYLDNPVETFFHDKDKEIVLILQRIKAALEKEEIEIKNKDKVFSLLSNQETLENLWKENQLLEKELKDFENASFEKIKNKLEETERHLASYQEKSRRVGKEIKELERKMDLSGEEAIKKELKIMINECLGTKIKLV